MYGYIVERTDGRLTTVNKERESSIPEGGGGGGGE